MRLRANAMRGVAPGVSRTTGHAALPLIASLPSAARRPALISDDFPLPELPVTATNRETVSRATSSDVASSRPQNRFASF
jgi:hypothetical protein